MTTLKLFFCLLFISVLQNTLYSQALIRAFEENKEIKLKGNETHTYEVLLKKGDFFQLHLKQKNVNLQVLLLSSQKDTLQGFLSNFRKDGLEIVEFPVKKSDTYIFQISPYISRWLKGTDRDNFIKNINGSYAIEKFKILSQKQYETLLEFRQKQKDSVVSWIQKKSITINSVIAETGFEDLNHLKPILKHIQVVGMGETSHGTKEIFQMKHRMLEFLVKEMGFTLFGIEASHVGCRPINDYVLHGKGNSRDALSAQGFWIWNTEEVIEMIEWMHNYNKTVPNTKKIKFIGIDTQTIGLDNAYDRINKYLKKTGEHSMLEVDVDSLFNSIKSIKDRSDLSKRRQKLYNLLSYLIANEINLIHISSKQEYYNIILDLKKIIQGVEAGDRKLGKRSGYNIRDEYMAQTVMETLEKEGSNAKMMLWAHNSHINKDPSSYTNGSQKPLGSALKRYLGDKKYYAIGFATYQGTFQARSYTKNKNTNVYAKAGSFKIYPGEEGHFDWYFAQSKKDRLYIHLKQLINPNAVQSFLNKNLKMHSAGATWTFDRSDSPIFNIIPGKQFDGIIFIKETSAAILTPAGKKELEKRIKEGR
ncbi:erythromycin esterase family protein [Aquimarina aggregata]|uniref:erythromycin esterase family protein n=1 Tax=Aquimarina aggregata TaxID=1642818 RepID=UPI002490DA3D|nr:erythromycin esterase family protein [Aquimarina aggregata]